MSDQPTGGDGSAQISSEIIVAAVIFVFITVAFVFFLYLYVKHCSSSEPGIPRYRARFMFAPSDLGPIPRRGLDTAILRSLPVTVFRSAEGGLECSVCLTELSEGEEARVLPKCSHGFHRECIDMWFHSHSTCPLCRCPVAVTVTASSPDSGAGSVEINIPPVSRSGSGYPPARSRNTREGSQEGLSDSSSTGRMLVIEIPTRAVAVDGFPIPSSISAVPEQQDREMKTPPSSRLRSLTRILSREKRTAESSYYSSRTEDIEQGFAGETGDAETPTNS